MVVIQLNVLLMKVVVVEHILECVMVELNMRKTKHFVVNCMYATAGANVGVFMNR